MAIALGIASHRAAGTMACFVCALWCASLSAHAGAQDATANAAPSSSAEADVAADAFARKVFAAGKSAYEIGNYREALQYFQQAYELSGRSQLLYNVGQAADRLRLDETALRALTLYLEKVPDADNRAEVEQRIAVLKEVVEGRQQATEAAVAAGQSVGASALSPAEVARAAQSAGSAGSQAPSREPSRDVDEGGLLTRWWFWAGAGAVVAVAIVTALALSGGGETTTNEPFKGTSGKVTLTLERSEAR